MFPHWLTVTMIAANMPMRACILLWNHLFLVGSRLHPVAYRAQSDSKPNGRYTCSWQSQIVQVKCRGFDAVGCQREVIRDSMILRVSDALRHYAYGLVRVPLAMIFIWFGLLKIMDRSPLMELMGQSILWIPSDIFIHLLGASDLLVGFGLLAGVTLHQTMRFFWPNLAGTFLILVVGDNAAQAALWSNFLEAPAMNAVVMASVGEFAIKTFGLAIGGFGGTPRKGGRSVQLVRGLTRVSKCSTTRRRLRPDILWLKDRLGSPPPTPGIRLHNILCRRKSLI